MDATQLQTLLNAISSIGFPGVMCYLMFKYLEKTTQNNSEQMTKLSEAINNNTVVMTKLAERSENNEK